MPPRVSEETLIEWARARAKYAPWLYAAIVLLVAASAHACWPIFAMDEDLWYHLAAGRYLFEHNALARDAFFSFVPDRPWENYYGLFQGLVFAVYQVGGYAGLVVFRTLAFTGTAALVLSIALRGERTFSQRAWSVVFAAFAIAVLSDRSRILRPHLISYLCTASFLALLLFEIDRRFTWLALLAIGTIWLNCHGVEYPVMLAILGAFAAEVLWRSQLNGGALSQPDRKRLVTCVVPMLCVLATPLGAHLLPIPFTPIVFASRYITELAPLSPGALGDFRLHHFALSSDGVAKTLLAAVLALTAGPLLRRRLEPHQWILLFVAIFLLLKGLRFTHEFALLSLPAVRGSVPRGTEAPERPRLPAAAFGLVAAALALPLLSLVSLVLPRPAWPLSREGLPFGAARFLAKQSAGIRVLNVPNHGGYLQWELYGRARVLMDMDVPFLFSDDDLYVAATWAHDPAVFEKVVSAHHPDFLAAPIDAPELGKFVASRFVPVFVDDAVVLYVDSAAHPQIAADWRIAKVDPFALAEADPAKFTAADRAVVRATLAKMIEVDRGITSVDTLASRMALADGDAAAAFSLGAEVVRSQPDIADGYVLEAEAKMHSAPAESENLFRVALSRVDAEHGRPIHARLRDAEEALGEFGPAYADALAAVDGFPIDANALDLYKLGVAASRARHFEDARMWMRFSWLRSTPRDVELRARLSKLLGGAPAAEPQPQQRSE